MHAQAMHALYLLCHQCQSIASALELVVYPACAVTASYHCLQTVTSLANRDQLQHTCYAMPIAAHVQSTTPTWCAFGGPKVEF